MRSPRDLRRRMAIPPHLMGPPTVRNTPLDRAARLELMRANRLAEANADIDADIRRARETIQRISAARKARILDATTKAVAAGLACWIKDRPAPKRAKKKTGVKKAPVPGKSRGKS